jgi:sodium transport system ATP-binding protein
MSATATPAPSTTSTIFINSLSKVFRDKQGERRAVDGISFDARKGEIFGLLGPNGAGKTTTLRMLATLLKPTSGTASLEGFDIVREPEQVRARIGFLTGDMGLYARLAPREILRFFGEFYGLNGVRLRSRVDEMIDRFGLGGFADIRTDKLSTGMKQRTAIARTALHDPPILILDEPTAGLDVPSARMIETYIIEQRSAGKCIILSTHVMEEAEYLCDRIAVIGAGQLKRVGTMAELREATGKQRLREIFLELLGID